MSEHLTYKFVPRMETVETALDFVVGEVARLAEECDFASSKFKLGHPKVDAFAKSAADLRALNVAEQVADIILLAPTQVAVEFSMHVPRRKAHHKARWSRVGDCARALRAVAGMIEHPTRKAQYLALGDALVSITFPKLYD